MKRNPIADNDPKRSGEHDQPGDAIDRALDAALAKYSGIEPRAGLEERVLAHLHAEPLSPTRPAWLQWGLAGSVVAIVIMAVLIMAVLTWRLSRASHSVVANHPPVTIQRPSTPETKTAPHAAEVSAAKRTLPRVPAARRAAPAARMLAKYPKLDQFPSAQPLSAEEIALARYVKNFPKEAQLVAQAQKEFEIETEKAMNDGGAETRPSGSIQQER